MQITVLDWNVKGLPDPTMSSAKLELIETRRPDVLLLQELTPMAFRTLEDRGWSGVHALQLLPKGHRGRAKGKEVRFSCAVLARGEWQITRAETHLGAPSPERWLAARVERDSTALDVGSFACPPGVDWGDMKTEQGRQIAEWMVRRERAVIAGVDRNGPKFEWADGTFELWPRDSPQLLGREPAHRLADVLLTLFQRQPDRLEQARVERPEGPLEVSYIRKYRGEARTRCRYDVIYASEDFDVAIVEYLYDEADHAGSDHAAVFATLHI